MKLPQFFNRFLIALVVAGSSVGPLPAASHPHIEIPTLLWGDSKRPDGTTRHWNPDPLIDLGTTLVCVAYRPILENGERWHSVGMTPPGVLVKTLKNTQPELDRCHQNNIKVVGYADTIMFHTDMLKADGIDAEDLYAIDRKGQRVINKMWDKSGAGVSCVMNPTWVELQKQVALTTAKAGYDGLQFDVYPYAIDPGYLCNCHYCREAWSKHSRHVFGTAQAFPGLDTGKLDFRNPVDREFKVWRLEQFAEFVKAVEARVRKTYPQFIIIMNHGAGTPDYTAEAVAGALRYPSTELWHLKLGNDSSLYLYSSTEAACGGQAIGLINFSTQYEPAYRYRVALAEAFGSGGTFYFVPRSRGEGEVGKISHDYCDFLRQRENWFNGSKSDAQVAVVYSWHDQAFKQGNPVADAKVEFDPKRNYYQRTAAVLARMGVPHDCLMPEKGMSRGDLNRYQVIVVPELSLVTEKNAAALEKYVRDGGRLLVIGKLGDVIESKQEWKALHQSLIAQWTGKEPAVGQMMHLGKGLISFVPRITTGEQVGAPPPSVDPDEAQADLKADKLAIPLSPLTEEFRRACDDIQLSGQLKIKSSTEVETIVRKVGQERIIHLIRFGAVSGITERSVAADYELPRGYTAADVTITSPELPGPTLDSSWKIADNRLTVNINRLDNYAVIAVTLQKKK